MLYACYHSFDSLITASAVLTISLYLLSAKMSYNENFDHLARLIHLQISLVELFHSSIAALDKDQHDSFEIKKLFELDVFGKSAKTVLKQVSKLFTRSTISLVNIYIQIRKQLLLVC